MVFQPGVSGNPGGRRKTVKRRVVLDVNFKHGKLDELEMLEAVISNGEAPLSTRMTAAAMILPYKRAKAGRFVERPLDIPESTCVADSKRAIAKLAAMARKSRSMPPMISSRRNPSSSKPRSAAIWRRRWPSLKPLCNGSKPPTLPCPTWS
jgi:hypothetical protein